MIWVCRAGMNSVHFDYYMSTQKVYLPWEGFSWNLSNYESREEYKTLVRKEKGDAPRTSISNWAGQLYSFCKEMDCGHYVLIPQRGSKKYAFAEVVGPYEYSPENENGLKHSRMIRIIANDIPRDAFSQSLQYSLGAYRTVFKVKNIDEVMRVISKYSK